MINPRDKVYELETLTNVTETWQSNGEKVVFTNGVFDLLHQGHLEILKYSKSLGDRLIVALNSDASVKRLKGEERPINNENLRSEIMASFYYVDAVIIFGEDTPLFLIQNLKPNYLVKGGDYKADEVVGAEDVKKNGGDVKIFHYLEGQSTTNVIRKFKK